MASHYDHHAVFNGTLNKGGTIPPVFLKGMETMIETILYGTRKGGEDWQEEIITTNPEAIEPARKWAEANGFDRFRIAKVDLSTPPDFRLTINKGGKRRKKENK